MTRLCGSVSPYRIIQWVKLKAQINGDKILVWISDNTNNYAYALIWDGAPLEIARNSARMSGHQRPALQETFDLAWEGSSGDAMVVFGGTEQLFVRQFFRR